MGNCIKCGLPQELCVCQTLARESEKITIATNTKRYKKMVTVIRGVNKEESKKVLKELKTRFACGGTIKDGEIELQGDHTQRIKAILVKMGFPAEQIEV